jgi:Flp pilus assembly protein TadG
MRALPTPPAERRSGRSAGSGQILVVFGLSFLVLISAAGLAVDAGGTYAQRRDQQVASDLAALAAANEYLVNRIEADAIDRARAVTVENGYAHGSGGAAVDVTIDTSVGVRVTVDVGAQHQNSFLRVLGMPHWDVTTSATALAGYPDTGVGAAPFVFSIGAFEDDGTPKYQTNTDFGTGNGDVPTSQLDFSWTEFGPNVNTSTVSSAIEGSIQLDEPFGYGDYIGAMNNGNHTALYGDVDNHLSGKEMPVAIVDSNGLFQGWSMFHVTSASGGTDKHIRGYFMAGFVSSRTQVTAPLADSPRYVGTYVLRLSD